MALPDFPVTREYFWQVRWTIVSARLFLYLFKRKFWAFFPACKSSGRKQDRQGPEKQEGTSMAETGSEAAGSIHDGMLPGSKYESDHDL